MTTAPASTPRRSKSCGCSRSTVSLGERLEPGECWASVPRSYSLRLATRRSEYASTAGESSIDDARNARRGGPRAPAAAAGGRAPSGGLRRPPGPRWPRPRRPAGRPRCRRPRRRRPPPRPREPHRSRSDRPPGPRRAGPPDDGSIARAVDGVDGEPGVAGRDGGDLVEDLVGRLDLQVAAQEAGELGGEHPVVARRAGRRDLAGHRADAALDVRGRAVGLGGTAGREHDIGLLGRRGEEAIDRDHRARAGNGSGGQLRVREVGERVGSQEHEHVDLAAGGRLQDARGVEAHLGRDVRPATLLEPVAGLVEGDPTREQSGGETHVERAVHVAAAQSAQEPHVGVRRVDRGGGGHDPVAGLGDVGPAEHDGDGAVGEERPRRRNVLGIDTAHLHVGRARQQGPHHITGGAGAVQERGGGELGG